MEIKQGRMDQKRIEVEGESHNDEDWSLLSQNFKNSLYMVDRAEVIGQKSCLKILVVKLLIGVSYLPIEAKVI
jgi:hypothetical protein